MDVQTIEQQFEPLQGRSRQTVQALQALCGILQAAVQRGDRQARERFLAFHDPAISFKAEQKPTGDLPRVVHGFVANDAQGRGDHSSRPPQSNSEQSPSCGQAGQGGLVPAPQPLAPPFRPRQGGGRIPGSFLDPDLGRASGTDAGFGAGDHLINKIFRGRIMRGPELIAAGWHHVYGPAYGMHHGFGGGGSWIGHMVVSSIVHGLIYGMIFRVLRRLSLGEIVLLAVVVIGGLYLWNRDRSYRRW